ncbi:MAG: aminotransferase class V-fold PLP-dependent enzyme [Gemmatimonadetes bacterium]|nr:aminotransferase class V-fold PLP-dependent enzyme [Gemmatimonadota bacterium]MYC91540.1 aminotransferase class V-fold PLP-dependent enzyme [Gemmatimonadota bacterium]MYG34198.1 aminotransferase class V-fold PLP-dependent enzyme [Gemmatimonadota bacterium]MYJ17349.1 aminotransferase class V-fold PLP-dependent enzyme [Gemmatimonadota bacterium]
MWPRRCGSARDRARATPCPQLAAQIRLQNRRRHVGKRATGTGALPHYLDYAATSAIRPPEVGRAMAAFLDGVACTPGRGGHSGAVEAARLAFRCRRALSRTLGLPGDPGRIAFMHNATHALNTALWGLLGPGDVLVISQYDHNAVLRPAHHLSRDRGVGVRMLSGSPDGGVDLEEAATLLDGASVLVANVASNVLGTLLPMRELSRIAHDAGAVVVADVAQSAGHSVESPATQGADVVAFTGHKGLLGPQGMGGLWAREGIEVDPLLSGGTGGDSRNREMPAAMPDRLEAGTGNSPGMAGLLAGCAFLRDTGVGAIHGREMALKARLRDGLDCIAGLQVLSPPGPEGVPVVTVKADGMDSASLAGRLDSEYGVQTRAGLHCAPEVHRILGTTESGAVRFSLGWASTQEDVDAAVAGVAQLLRPVSVPVARAG